MTVEAMGGGPPTIDQMRSSVAEVLGSTPAAIPDDANLFQLGLDSLGVMRLVTLWRRDGVRVSSRDLVAQPTLLAWQAHLELMCRVAQEESGALSADGAAES